MNKNTLSWARHSLVFVWLWTAIVSIQQFDGLSQALLREQTQLPPTLFAPIIWGGSAVDAVLGALMAWRPRRWVYLAALGMTLAMTVVGTWLSPGLWLHPLGPLSKNLPILALLWILARESSS